jgi:hypothetical protein
MSKRNRRRPAQGCVPIYAPSERICRTENRLCWRGRSSAGSFRQRNKASRRGDDRARRLVTISHPACFKNGDTVQSKVSKQEGRNIYDGRVAAAALSGQCTTESTQVLQTSPSRGRLGLCLRTALPPPAEKPRVVSAGGSDERPLAISFVAGMLNSTAAFSTAAP